MTDRHLGQMILDRARERPQSVAFRVRRDAGYADITWGEVLPRVDAVAAGLLSAAPLTDGARITFLGNTSLEAVLLDYAALSVGLHPVFVYASLLAEEVGYMHVDTAAQLVVVENAAQLEKVRRLRGGFRFFDVAYGADSLTIKGRVIVVDPAGLAPADDWESFADAEARGRAQLAALKTDMDRRAASIQRSHTATFAYTSGTTGLPKAVVQTHDNLLSFMENIGDVNLFDANAQQHGLLLFMPLAHVFGRFAELGGAFYGVPLVLSTIPALATDLALARPGIFSGAPRVFDKMMSKIQSIMGSAPPARRAVFNWALGVGKQTVPYVCVGKPLPRGLALKHRLADKLVLSKVRARLGLDRASTVLSGGSALSAEVQEFFMALGLLLIEAYGMTECCPGITINRKNHVKNGTVGRAVRGVTVRIAADGEILAKGPNIMGGYLNRPDATAEAFDGEGWFHTGDLGALDADGFLTITGRKKDLLKTSGGKQVAPLKLESRLKALPFVQEAVVTGDNRPYVTCLFFLEPEALREWCQREAIPADPATPGVHRAIEKLVADVNGGLASFESVKHFRVAPGPLSVEGGELTPSLKVKRKVVSEKYRSLIEEMYREEAGAGAA